MTPAGAPANPAHDFVVADGIRLHLLDYGGRGRPIVLLHGVGGHAWMWAEIAPALAEIGRPLALDLRGFGESQWSDDRAYATEDHRDDLARVAGALELGRVDLVGFSWGGLVALAYTAAYPDRVRRLVIIDIAPSSALAETALPPGITGRFADHAEAVEAQRRLAPRASDAQLEIMAAFDTRSHPDGGLETRRDPLFLERWPFRADDRWDELRALDAPTLVVRAADSVVLSPAEAEQMVAEAPAARLVTVPEAGHLVVLEQPAAVRRTLVEFLRG